MQQDSACMQVEKLKLTMTPVFTVLMLLLGFLKADYWGAQRPWGLLSGFHHVALKLLHSALSLRNI